VLNEHGLAPNRSKVERAFGTLEHSYGRCRVRHRGLSRDGAHPHPLRTVVNRHRGERLTA
jgi:hypothetical protein